MAVRIGDLDMDDLLLKARFGDHTDVWISDVSRETFDANELDDMGTDFGYFLMAGDKGRSRSGTRILAKLSSHQAALELFTMLTSSTTRCRQDKPTQDQVEVCTVSELFPSIEPRPRPLTPRRRRRR